jgi:hypothetical protein
MSNYTPQDSVPVVAHKTGVTQGRAKERALIVEWLRSKQFLIPDHLGNIVADYIEAGEYLK